MSEEIDEKMKEIAQKKPGRTRLVWDKNTRAAIPVRNPCYSLIASSGKRTVSKKKIEQWADNIIFKDSRWNTKKNRIDLLLIIAGELGMEVKDE